MSKQAPNRSCNMLFNSSEADISISQSHILWQLESIRQPEASTQMAACRSTGITLECLLGAHWILPPCAHHGRECLWNVLAKLYILSLIKFINTGLFLASITLANKPLISPLKIYLFLTVIMLISKPLVLINTEDKWSSCPPGIWSPGGLPGEQANWPLLDCEFHI